MPRRPFPKAVDRIRVRSSRAKLFMESLEDRQLLVAAGTAIKLTFGESQNSYVLKSFSPQNANIAPPGVLIPRLNLEIGDRYTATIGGSPQDPLELIAGGATPFDDIVLLAQVNESEPSNQTSIWESDPAVDWIADPLANSASFTLTPPLAAAMFNPFSGLTPQYRGASSPDLGFERGPLVLGSGDLPAENAAHDGFGDSFDNATTLSLAANGSGKMSRARSRFRATSTSFVTLCPRPDRSSSASRAQAEARSINPAPGI